MNVYDRLLVSFSYSILLWGPTPLHVYDMILICLHILKESDRVFCNLTVNILTLRYTGLNREMVVGPDC